ncbi:MAG: START domain-containing protein [Candidatus Scalindua sp.]|nr:START domain-containing protein [Candidatus Scalindua sp.]
MKIGKRLVSRKQTGAQFLLFLSFLLVAALFSCIPLTAEEEGWQPVMVQQEVKVYKRMKEGSRFFEFKAVGSLSGTISDYVSVLLETESMPHWVPLCIEAQNIEQINDRETIIYVACKGVWPVADREYTARRVLIRDPAIGAIRLDIELVDRQDTHKVARRVKISHLKSHWILKKIDSTHTHVELYADVDPGGWLPAWLVNSGYRKVPYRFLRELEIQVADRFRRIPVVATVTLHP